jgi:hypothetical protein
MHVSTNMHMTVYVYIYILFSQVPKNDYVFIRYSESRWYFDYNFLSVHSVYLVLNSN